jgi:hypothetical protein
LDDRQAAFSRDDGQKGERNQVVLQQAQREVRPQIERVVASVGEVEEQER